MSKKSAELSPVDGADAVSGDKNPGDKKGKKSKKKMIIILVVVLVLGGGGYFAFGKGGGKPPPPKPGVVLPLTAITVNLSAGHFLKLGIALQATTKAAKDVDGSKALDIAIEVYSNLSTAQLSSSVARDKIKKVLVTKITKAYDGEIMDVYLTEFVMQ
jgi:flagellar FliL protein